MKTSRCHDGSGTFLFEYALHSLSITDFPLSCLLRATIIDYTKKEVIEEALRTLVRLRSQEQIRTLRGQLHWEGDLDTMREE